MQIRGARPVWRHLNTTRKVTPALQVTSQFPRLVFLSPDTDELLLNNKYLVEFPSQKITELKILSEVRTPLPLKMPVRRFYPLFTKTLRVG
jgi:hypothetical protein